MNSKHEGRIVYYGNAKHYALIAEKIPAASGGYYVEKYYLPLREVCFQMSDEVVVGQYARFEASPTPARGPKEYRTARNVELFDTADQMETFRAAMSEVR